MIGRKINKTIDRETIKGNFYFAFSSYFAAEQFWDNKISLLLCFWYLGANIKGPDGRSNRVRDRGEGVGRFGGEHISNSDLLFFCFLYLLSQHVIKQGGRISTMRFSTY